LGRLIDVGRHDHRVGLRGQQARLVDVLFGDEQLHRLIPAGRLDRLGRLGHRANALGRGVGTVVTAAAFSFSPVEPLLLGSHRRSGSCP